jgi:F-type H+-transporting ATPase subunit g
VYLKEGMSPPSGAQFSETWNVVRKELSNPTALFKQAMQYTDLAKLQAVGWQPIVRGGLRGIELFGFFVVGEMIGRRSLMGYQV